MESAIILAFYYLLCRSQRGRENGCWFLADWSRHHSNWPGGSHSSSFSSIFSACELTIQYPVLPKSLLLFAASGCSISGFLVQQPNICLLAKVISQLCYSLAFLHYTSLVKKCVQKCSFGSFRKLSPKKDFQVGLKKQKVSYFFKGFAVLIGNPCVQTSFIIP